MNKTIKIKTKTKTYDIIIKNNSIFKEIFIDIDKYNKTYIIIDNKLNKIILRILKLKINRSSRLVAIGGGTIGDLSGYIASTILRGVSFVLIPTTLLSQVDSSIGGKNGINTKYGKNLIGTFYQPDKVIVDPTILKSLPIRERKSGYAEILKHGLIKDINFYKWLCKNYSKIINLDLKFTNKAIIKSIIIKSHFVNIDEKENLINSNSRAMLNFGHTFGHALETMNRYNNELNHGEAIAIGMSLAMKITNKMGNISVNEYNNFIQHLINVKLPHSHEKTKQKKLFDLMLSDKKNTNGNINLILLKKIGKCYFERGLNRKEIQQYLK